jgi:hypothetical protein
MCILRAIERSFKDKEERGFDKLYYFFDIHGTILKPNYEYGKIPKEFYPHALETLQFISNLTDIVMCLYTCSHSHEIEEYITLFKENNINFKYVNENPEVKTQLDGYGCYDKKPYMNVLFEDKASFDAETEWEIVLNYLINKR